MRLLISIFAFAVIAGWFVAEWFRFKRNAARRRAQRWCDQRKPWKAEDEPEGDY